MWKRSKIWKRGDQKVVKNLQRGTHSTEKHGFQWCKLELIILHKNYELAIIPITALS